jgi:hypothetical protein
MWKGTSATLKAQRNVKISPRSFDYAQDRAGAPQEADDACQVRRPGGSVGQGHAVEEEARGESAQEEVLESRLAGLQPSAVEAGQHVKGDGKDLQCQEDDDQVGGGAHQHHASGGQEEQGVVLAGGHFFPNHVLDGDENR